MKVTCQKKLLCSFMSTLVTVTRHKRAISRQRAVTTPGVWADVSSHNTGLWLVRCHLYKASHWSIVIIWRRVTLIRPSITINILSVILKMVSMKSHCSVSPWPEGPVTTPCLSIWWWYSLCLSRVSATNHPWLPPWPPIGQMSANTGLSLVLTVSGHSCRCHN